MPRTVTARFETEEEAERGLSAVAAEVPLRDSAVVGGGVAGSLTLGSLQLTPDERSACEQQLQKGGFLLVAQVASESRGEAVLRLLENVKREGAPQTPAASAALGPAEAIEEPADEERIPIVEEELRIGKREVVSGRSRVRSFVAEVPVQEQVELLHEETHIERRTVDRRLTDEEVSQGGLLQERVIEIAEMREEAVVTKEAFVREEVVVTKSVHRRVEQIDETVRRTEVETERLE
jgi:uncharacterized protein (TIGR02271 family)